MIKRIHVNQHHIKRNRKQGTKDPVITVKDYKSNTYGYWVHIEGPCDIVYSPDKPLKCGAEVWIETTSEVHIGKAPLTTNGWTTRLPALPVVRNY